MINENRICRLSSRKYILVFHKIFLLIFADINKIKKTTAHYIHFLLNFDSMGMRKSESGNEEKRVLKARQAAYHDRFF